LKRNLISYNKFIKLQPFIIVFVDVSATAAAFVETTVRQDNRMDRWIREAIHIRKEQDRLMNRDEESYQLPHIYDYLLSATATPGGRTFHFFLPFAGAPHSSSSYRSVVLLIHSAGPDRARPPNGLWFILN